VTVLPQLKTSAQPSKSDWINKNIHGFD
jgi:hypothetical protein